MEDAPNRYVVRRQGRLADGRAHNTGGAEDCRIAENLGLRTAAESTQLSATSRCS